MRLSVVQSTDTKLCDCRYYVYNSFIRNRNRIRNLGFSRQNLPKPTANKYFRTVTTLFLPWTIGLLKMVSTAPAVFLLKQGQTNKHRDATKCSIPHKWPFSHCGLTINYKNHGKLVTFTFVLLTLLYKPVHIILVCRISIVINILIIIHHIPLMRPVQH